MSMRADSIPFAWDEGSVTRIWLNLQKSDNSSGEIAVAQDGGQHRRGTVAACIASEGSGAMVGVPSLDESELADFPKVHPLVLRHTNFALGRPLTARRFGVDEAQVKLDSWV